MIRCPGTARARADRPPFELAYDAARIEAHADAIERCARAASESPGAAVRRFADRALPVLRDHRARLGELPR